MLLGGGFGRKSKWDFAIEAALMTKAMDGAPVKVVWTREDDIRHGFYHTVTAERLEAGIDKDNKVVAWRHRSAAPSLFANFMPDPKYHAVHRARTMGFVDTPFNVPNRPGWRAARRSRTCASAGSARSNNVAHAWAIQSFIAEIAKELGRDPKDMLLELIGPARIVEAPEKATTPWWDYGEPHDVYPVDTARLRRVTNLVAKKAGWGKKLPPGHGLGIAAHRSFVSYIATVVEVAVDDKGGFSIPRVDTAIDCGFCVNPERVRSQIEGAAVMGLSLAKYGEITLKNGRVEQSNFNDYPDRSARWIADRDQYAHRREQHRCAVEPRRRRAGRAAVCARALQRHLCGDRQTHPPAADRQSVWRDDTRRFRGANKCRNSGLPSSGFSLMAIGRLGQDHSSKPFFPTKLQPP